MCSWLQSIEEQAVENQPEVLARAPAIPVTGALAGVQVAAAPEGTSGTSWLSSYLGSLVYGGLDGIITTFAIVSGVSGANLNPGVALILGVANLIGDGFSMATGAYLSTKSQNEQFERAHRATHLAYNEDPQGQEHKLRQAYIEQGYTPQQAHWVVSVFRQRPSQFVHILVRETADEFAGQKNPRMEAIATFAAFLVFGVLPLLPYLLQWIVEGWQLPTFLVSAVVSAVALFTLGALKVRFTHRGVLRSGLEMLVTGGLAAGVAYGIGALLRGAGLGE